MWSSCSFFARQVLELASRLGYAAFVPGPRGVCRADYMVLDSRDAGLAGACAAARIIEVDGSSPLQASLAVVEALAGPPRYLVGLDPGGSIGFAVLASDTIVYWDVLRSPADAEGLLCSLASAASRSVLVGIGYSPTTIEQARGLARAAASCGLEAVLVDEHGSNSERLPGLGLDAGIPVHVRAAAAIALRASMEPGGGGGACRGRCWSSRQASWLGFRGLYG